MAPNDHYTIISADGHAGGSHAQYREYLDPAWRDEFDAWRGKYKNPFRDLQDDGRTRNWDTRAPQRRPRRRGRAPPRSSSRTRCRRSSRRASSSPRPRAPRTSDRRLAGLRAHNRWLVDFVAESPERRCRPGPDPPQRRRRGRRGRQLGPASRASRGILLPGVSPDTPWIDPLFSETYDPLWAVCQELEMSITHHAGGSGHPELRQAPVGRSPCSCSSPASSPTGPSGTSSCPASSSASPASSS